jgi:hypothetical protein
MDNSISPKHFWSETSRAPPFTAQEKRAEQLKALGIQENEIGTDVIQTKKKPGADGKTQRTYMKIFCLLYLSQILIQTVMTQIREDKRTSEER